MTRLYKRSEQNQRGGAEKYYIKCGNPTEAFKDPHGLDVNKERAIVRALMDDGSVGANRRIVVKIGASETINKEYTYGEQLQSIPGFIKFICRMKCHDAIERYKSRASVATVCTENEKDPMVNIIVMPFYPLGSARAYDWIKRPDQFKSCVLQIVLSLREAFTRCGFLHVDIHLDNVLLSHTSKQTITYVIGDDTYPVSTHGIRIHIMDFERAMMPVDARHSHSFYGDIERIFQDIKYAMKLRFDTLKPILDLLAARSFYDAPMKDLMDVIIPLIEAITAVRIDDVRPITYDPNVF